MSDNSLIEQWKQPEEAKHCSVFHAKKFYNYLIGNEL